MSSRNKSKMKQILLKQSRNKECFEALVKCAFNKEDQLNSINNITLIYRNDTF